MSQVNVLYGYLSGMTTAITLQPLDNIKIALMIPPSNLNFYSKNPLLNFYIACKFLAHQQGFKAFYKGTFPNIIKTSLSSAIYFHSLRQIEKVIKSSQQSIYTAFIASSLGRTMSSFTTNPLSIIQSRMELAGQERWKGSIVKNLFRLIKQEGINGCFKGSLASCYKQGLFAGFYYTLYEKGKSMGVSSFASGLISGVIATTLTHPFELIRARLQVCEVIHNNKLSLPIHSQIIQLSKTGQLFKGLTPRIIKKPLSNTLAFLIFQYFQKKQVEEKLQN